MRTISDVQVKNFLNDAAKSNIPLRFIDKVSLIMTPENIKVTQFPVIFYTTSTDNTRATLILIANSNNILSSLSKSSPTIKNGQHTHNSSIIHTSGVSPKDNVYILTHPQEENTFGNILDKTNAAVVDSPQYINDSYREVGIYVKLIENAQIDTILFLGNDSRLIEFKNVTASSETQHHNSMYS